MIYGLFIFDWSGKVLFQKFYKDLKFDNELTLRLLRDFAAYIQKIDHSERIETLSFEDLKIVYSIHDVKLFALCIDKSDDEMYIANKLIKLQKEFIPIDNVLKAGKAEDETEQEDEDEDIAQRVGENSYGRFELIVDEILFPFFKMAILGQGGVGKTSLLKLVMGEDQDSTYSPTVGVDVKEFDFEPKKMKLVFWDFSGQQRYRKLWQPFLEGADIAILVTDSKIQNLAETKGILDLIKAEKPDIKILLVANKQDLPDATPPETIENYLGMKAHGFVATDPKNRKKILELLKKTIQDITEAKSQKVKAPKKQNLKELIADYKLPTHP
ncbi:MAG: ADP-ribosylation factor-like protein [Candidatus Freyarchaeum deiterrae]